jgi:hypothetical protein
MSDPPPERPAILQRLSWKAVLFGFVVDYGGSTVFGFVAGILGGIMYASRGSDPEQIQQTLLSSTPFLTVMMTMGLIFVTLGGFVAARLAPQAPYLNAAALAFVDVILGCTAFFDGLPAWYLAVAFPATPPCALLGAFIAGLFASREPQS